MTKQYSLNDTLNLRDSILMITDHIKVYGRAVDEPRTLVKFIEQLLSGTMSDGAKLETIKKELQKAFSGNLPLSKLESLLQIFDDEGCRTAVYNNLCTIAQTLYNVSGSDAFFQTVLKKISLRFFTQDEKETLNALVSAGKYSDFLYQIIRHGVRTPYNVPCFFADRIYDEALTYDYDSPMRYALMQTAADNGNKRAALEYGNYLAKHGPYDPAFDYLLLALPIQAALWNLACLIETHKVGPDRLNQFKLTAKIDERLSAAEFSNLRQELDATICSAENSIQYENLTYAYKTYFYLAQKGFFKAYNSLAKLLTLKQIIIKSDCTAFSAETLARKYYQKAIQGGNVIAMCNEGSRLLKQQIGSAYAPGSTQEQYMLELMQISAEADVVRSYYNLGVYYEYAAKHSSVPLKSREEIRAIYARALELDIDKSGIRGDLLIRLGKLSRDPWIQKDYFEQALQCGSSDAAYYLAREYYNRYAGDWNDYRKRQFNSLIEDNMPYMSIEIKRETQSLQEMIAHQEAITNIPYDDNADIAARLSTI